MSPTGGLKGGDSGDQGSAVEDEAMTDLGGEGGLESQRRPSYCQSGRV